MPTPIAVVFIHGINVTHNDYHEAMQKRLRKALPRTLHPYVAFRAVYWADIVRGRQTDFLNAAAIGGFRSSGLHRLVLEGLGDAAAYQKTRDYRNSAYYKIQGRVRETFNGLDSPDMAGRPLVIIAHSLGCHIASSYAWDLHKIKQLPEVAAASLDEPTRDFARWAGKATPFMRLDTFAGFVTMGSNMPLFTFMFGPDKVIPITSTNDERLRPAFPGAGLPPSFAAKAKWLNFYSLNDPLGYPLKPLNDRYRNEARLTDTAVISEGKFRAAATPRAFNALKAHSGYWHTPEVIGPTAALLRGLIETPAA